VSVRSFDAVELGDDLPDVKPDVSMATIRRFADATGMNAARFTDHEKAKKAGLPGAIVPGIMSQGLLAALVHAWAPGCTIKKLDAIFRSHLLVDSQPTCHGVVTDTDDEARCVEIDLTISNERGENPVVGTATVQLG
jgi:acyl dehydratase